MFVTNTVISSEEDGQAPLDMVHVNIFGPKIKADVFVVGSFMLAKIPAPEVTLQVPIPTNGEFAFKFMLVRFV